MQCRVCLISPLHVHVLLSVLLTSAKLKFADKQIVKILLDNGADCLYKTNNTDNGLGSIAGVSFSCFDFLLSKPICGKEIIRMILEHQNTKLITEKEKKAFKSSGYSLAYRVMMMSDKVDWHNSIT